jgi:hypothetical protein
LRHFVLGGALLVAPLLGCSIQTQSAQPEPQQAPPASYEQQGDDAMIRASYEEAFRFYSVALSNCQHGSANWDPFAEENLSKKRQQAGMEACRQHLAKGQASLAANDNPTAIVELQRADDLCNYDSTPPDTHQRITALLAKATGETH